MTIHLPKRVIEHRSFLDMRYVMMIASLVIEKALTHRCNLVSYWLVLMIWNILLVQRYQCPLQKAYLTYTVYYGKTF